MWLQNFTRFVYKHVHHLKHTKQSYDVTGVGVYMFHTYNSIQSIASTLYTVAIVLIYSSCNVITYTTAAHEGDDEWFDPPGGTDYPDEADEENNAEYVLDAWKVDAEHRAELPRLREKYQ